MEGHFSTCDLVGHQVKRGESCWEFSVACAHCLMLGWEEDPLISHKGPFQGRGSVAQYMLNCRGTISLARAEGLHYT